jgi:ADP-ribose pyrophosphatase
MAPNLLEDIDRFKETTLSSERVFDGQLLKVNVDKALLADGTLVHREWIKHPGACAIVPLFDNGETILLRQYRYGPARMFWEVPAGKIDSGEPIEQTASRELLEETGYRAKQLQKIGHFYPAIGFCDEIIHVFVASDLGYEASNTDEDERVDAIRFSLENVFTMLYSGEIEDGKTLIVLEMLRRHLLNLQG